MEAPDAMTAQGWEAALAGAAALGRKDLIGLSWREGASETASEFTIIDQLMRYGVVGRKQRKVGLPIHREGGVVCFYRRRVYDSIMDDMPVWIVEIRAASGALIGMLVVTEEELLERGSAGSFVWGPRSPAHGQAPTQPRERARVRVDSRVTVLEQLWEFRERLAGSRTDMTGLAWMSQDGHIQVVRDVLVDDRGSFHTKQLRRWAITVTDGEGRVREVDVSSMADIVARVTHAAECTTDGLECTLPLPPIGDGTEITATIAQQRYVECLTLLGLDRPDSDDAWVETDLTAAGHDPGSAPTDSRWLEVVDRRLGAAFATAAVPLTKRQFEIDPRIINRVPDLVRSQVEGVLAKVTREGRTLKHKDLEDLGRLLRRSVGS